MKSERNFGLDVLRSAAIVLVLVSHGSKFFPTSLTQNYPDTFWSLGVFGVELFYALSGFLIGGLLLRIQENHAGAHSIVTFLVRRWLRTLPLYYVVLVALFFFPNLDPAPRADTWSYFVMAQNLLSPMPAWNWFGPSWSLTIEEWSYVILPLIAFGFLGRHRQSLAIAGFVLIALGLVTRLVLSDPMEPWDETVRKVVATRIDAIAYGVLLASASARWGNAVLRRWAWRLLPISISICIVTYLFCQTRSAPPADMPTLHSFYARIFMVAATGIALTAFIPITQNWSAPRFVTAPVFFIARISYALYLCHWPFLFILDKPQVEWKVPLFLLGTFVTAVVLSYGIEQPIMRLRPRQI
jgi:peptidoglycan/LPS O-acetylase OafA/YrhL